MNTLTRLHPTKASFASRLMLLVLVAGVLEPGPGSDRTVRSGIEVLFRASEVHRASRVIVIAPRFAGIRDVDCYTPYPVVDWRYCHVNPGQNVGRINTRPLSSPCVVTAFCNIRHQNTDEDDAFAYPSAVA